ncbi:MAG: alpha/beta hydrolase, partial [Bacteroidota bacterium]
MKKEEFNYQSSDLLNIYTYKWLPDVPSQVKGVLLIVHGSVEHAMRYEHVAEFFIRNGYIVYAPDMRGHGKTGKESDQLSFFAKKNGWQLILEDLSKLHYIIKENHPGLPVFIFGHSMGSFIVRDFIANYSKDLKGAVICGSTIGKPALAKSGIILGKLLSLFYGKKSPTPLIHDMLYGKLSRA